MSFSACSCSFILQEEYDIILLLITAIPASQSKDGDTFGESLTSKKYAHLALPFCQGLDLSVKRLVCSCRWRDVDAWSLIMIGFVSVVIFCIMELFKNLELVFL